jgi:anti-sigma regulatory factor (Ser/Thr protein kinase)
VHHEALLYAAPEELVERCLPFVREGVAAGDAVLVMLPSPNLAELQRALGPTGDSVHFADMRAVGRNPAHILPIWQRFIDEHGVGQRPVRGIGEPVWKGRSPDELVECQLHEALLDLAFPDAEVAIVCPYDTEQLDTGTIDEARRSHGVVVTDGASASSAEHAPSEAVTRLRRTHVPTPPPDALSERFDRSSIAHLRRLTDALARDAGMTDSRVDDLALAVSEIATNSVLHGGGGGIFSAWVDDGAVVCEVRDAGRFVDPFAGRRVPTRDSSSGRGLWIANQVCDLVQIRDTATGSIIRLRQQLR